MRIRDVIKEFEKKGENLGKSVTSKLKKKVSSKRILKRSRGATIILPEHEPAPYEPIYFKKEMEDAKKSMFL